MIQKILLTQGCPNGCQFCYEPQREFKTFEVPAITERYVQILDMNFLANPRAMEILGSLPKAHYELVCGFDWRRFTPDFAYALRAAGFIKVRWAWDYFMSEQKKHRAVFRHLVAAGYRPRDLMVFMLVNWKTPFTECCRKLDLLKIWNVQVCDCCWDGGYTLAKPVYWTPEQLRKFRAMCRKHNQLVRFKIDPEAIS